MSSYCMNRRDEECSGRTVSEIRKMIYRERRFIVRSGEAREVDFIESYTSNDKDLSSYISSLFPSRGMPSSGIPSTAS